MKNLFKRKPKIIKQISFKLEDDNVQIFDCKTKKDIRKAIKIGMEWIWFMSATNKFNEEYKKKVIPSYDVTFKSKEN